MSGPVDVRGVIRATIEQLRATGDTGLVENLLDADAAVAELIERLEASSWRLAELLALIPTGRPERAQIEHDMADNRAALARAGGAA